MSTKPILGYWNQRGLGHPIRFLLTYLGVDFTDKRYSRGADGKGSEWFQGDKNKLGLDFPNLPYYIDGDVKISQSLTILRYIAAKYSLDGASIVEKNRIILLEQQVVDLMTGFYQLALRPNYDDLSYDFLEILETVQLKQLVAFLGDRPWTAGAHISYVDFWLYEYLVKIRAFAPEVWRKFPTLEAFVKRIEELPKIKEFIAKEGPLIFSGPKYAWNGKY
uniref:glutathione transferase n=1 Tax=Aleuroglyphus ovatus TaxID=212130 RepID=B0KZK3_ALEOV|nr:allergen Ale o 8 [Aleuroglyphus ovatus]